MNKKVIAVSEILVLMFAIVSFSYFVYYGSGGERNPLDNLFSAIGNSLSQPLIPSVSAAGTLSQPSVCCEKTKDGAYCINTKQENCAAGKTSPTSCDTTSYCKLGTCYDSKEGICMENTPQLVCQQNNGTWDERPAEEVAQCQLGCCVIADQAAFVPLVRCKRLSTFFGVANDYRKEVTNEVECIATAQSQDMGACVFEQDFSKTCKFTTRKECAAKEGVIAVNSSNSSITSTEKKFYKDYLCSAEELGTDCARQTTTGCYQGGVYWFDSCGNRENIYSADKEKSWNRGKVANPDSICKANDGSQKDCGNCDYLSGSRCGMFEKGVLGLGGPAFGDYICKKTDCVDKESGAEYKNGESWCVYDQPIGNGSDPTGGRYFRKICTDGQIKVEPCADYRNQICLQGGISTEEGNFRTAACRVNRWQDCVAITDKKDCQNQDKRDCMWLPSVVGMILGGQSQGAGGGFSNPTSTTPTFSNPAASATTGNVIAPITGFASKDSEEEKTISNRKDGICVPNYPPGLKFWENGDAKGICGQASAKCIVKFEKKLIGGESCVENCECLEEGWAMKANKVCAALGDCGGYINYQGKYTDDGYVWKIDGKKKKFTPNNINKITSGFTGKVIAETAVVGGIIAFIFSKIGFAKGFTSSDTPPSNPPSYTPPKIDTSQPSFGPSSPGYPQINPGQTFLPYSLPVVASDIRMNIPELTSGDSLGGASNIRVGDIPELTSGDSLGGASNIRVGDFPRMTPGDANPASGASAGVSAVTAAPNLGSFIAKNPFQFTDAAGKTVMIPKGTLIAQQANGEGLATLADGSKIALTPEQLVSAGKGGFIGDAPKPTSTNTLSKLFGATAGGTFDAMLTGLQWAGIAYGLGYLIGSIAGMDADNTQALSMALAGGAFTWQFLSTLGPESSLYNMLGGADGFLLSPTGSLVAGIGVAAAIFIFMYKKTDTQTVTFTCQPWQAPVGGNECEKCNSDNNNGLPCSEYRCRALGQNCELVNKGTTEEKCVNVNPKDVEPPIISPNEKELTAGHKYSDVKLSPPGPGFKIISTTSSDGCIKAFTPLKFGISVDEPAQCKIDFNHTESFDEMSTWFGGNNLFSYNHTEQFALPGPKAMDAANLTIQNGGQWTFFIRCRDKNGNTNEAEYAVRFCVDPTPDNTAPEIKVTSILNEGCVAENQNNANVEFYVNEPAECKWSHEDKSYENMENSMQCATELYQVNALQLYPCIANLSGISKDMTEFYVRCKDQPGKTDSERNKNAQSYKLSLRGSNALKIRNLMPNGTIFGSTRPAPVQLEVETLFGCDNGKAICYYSTSGQDKDYIMFFDTNTESGVHKQRQDLDAGAHTYYIKCVDSGGNLAVNTTSFNLEIDTAAPVIARAYHEDKLLKIVTIRNSQCAYSFNDCDFSFQEGVEMPYANSTVHVTEWKTDKTYYIKCRDEFRNEPADCSMVVRPYSKV